jgi:HEPN domain-containing protein
MNAGLSHKPEVLYQASLERMEEAQAALDRCRYVLAIYLSGLAVECVLQAIVLREHPQHDSKHNLAKWLSRCRPSLQDAVKASGIRESWALLIAVWRNELRYYSEAGLLGHLRRIDRARGISGGSEAILRVNAQRLLEAASVVQK